MCIKLSLVDPDSQNLLIHFHEGMSKQDVWRDYGYIIFFQNIFSYHHSIHYWYVLSNSSLFLLNDSLERQVLSVQDPSKFTMIDRNLLHRNTQKSHSLYLGNLGDGNDSIEIHERYLFLLLELTVFMRLCQSRQMMSNSNSETIFLVVYCKVILSLGLNIHFQFFDNSLYVN